MTNRKRPRHDLEVPEVELQAAINLTPLMIARCGRDLHYRFVSRAYAKLFGCTPEMIVGKSVADVIGEEGFQTIQPRVNQVLQGHTLEFEIAIDLNGVGHRHLSVVYAPEITDSGQVTGWTESIVDISERRRTEELLRESEERYAAIFDRSPFGVGLTRMPEGVLVAANDAFLTLFGYSREEVIGKTSLVSGISNEESSAEVAAELNRNGRVREFECVRTTKLGDSRVLSLNLDWVSIGGSRHVLTTIRDVTGQRAAEQARQASDAKMQAILRAHPDLMFVQDRDGTYLDFYAPATSELYAAPEQFLGRRFQDVLPATAFELIAPAFSSVATSGESAAVEYQLAMPQGTRFYEARMVRLPPDKVLSIVRDLTDEKRTREELDQSKYFAQRLTETMPSVIGVLDLDQLRVLYINDHSEAITGYSAAEVIAMGNQFCARTMHPDEFRDLPRVLERFARAKDGEVLEHVIRFRHKTGGWRWIQRYGTVFARDANGRPTQVLSSGTDITKLKVVEDELRSLSARLRNTQDEERRRIARELHDGVAQSLFGMSASLTALLHSGNLPHHTANALAECAQLCDDGLKEVRLMSYVLHPPLLDDAGLVPALQWFADGLRRRSGITIEFEAAETDRQPLALEHDLFRIVQEALTNVIRHSGSPRAVVRFDHQPHQLVLQIQDFGRGMPTTFESNDGGVYATGVGILGMRERLRHLGGRLKIQSGAEGTTLTAIVPLTSDPTR